MNIFEKIILNYLGIVSPDKPIMILNKSEKSYIPDLISYAEKYSAKIKIKDLLKESFYNLHSNGAIKILHSDNKKLMRPGDTNYAEGMVKLTNKGKFLFNSIYLDIPPITLPD